jgi:hypothetical protein
VTGNPGSVSRIYADGAHSYSITATASDEDGTYAAGEQPQHHGQQRGSDCQHQGPATGARGQVRTFTLGAADVSAIDQTASFQLQHQWGDGSSPW